MKRGDIWTVEYPLVSRQNAEPYGHGPVVIVSSDSFNVSGISTVMVSVITSNIKLARAPGNVLVLAEPFSGLTVDSVVNVSQVLVVDKTRLIQRRGQLDETSLGLLNLGLKLVFALS